MIQQPPSGSLLNDTGGYTTIPFIFISLSFGWRYLWNSFHSHWYLLLIPLHEPAVSSLERRIERELDMIWMVSQLGPQHSILKRPAVIPSILLWISSIDGTWLISFHIWWVPSKEIPDISCLSFGCILYSVDRLFYLSHILIFLISLGRSLKDAS